MLLGLDPTLFLICTSASPTVISNDLIYGAPPPTSTPERPGLTLAVPNQELALLPVEMRKSTVVDHC